MTDPCSEQSSVNRHEADMPAHWTGEVGSTDSVPGPRNIGQACILGEEMVFVFFGCDSRLLVRALAPTRASKSGGKLRQSRAARAHRALGERTRASLAPRKARARVRL